MLLDGYITDVFDRYVVIKAPADVGYILDKKTTNERYEELIKGLG